MNIRFTASILIFFLFTPFSPAWAEEEIFCEGLYGGHLQGIAVDPGNAIYWSFTVELVRTDMRGNFVASVPVASHHGDLTLNGRTLYVAVNLGEFNREPGHADSWVYIYDAVSLAFLARHKIQEAVHGAGGIAVRGGRFFVVGGIPEGYKENYVYEYDNSFNFIIRHVLNSGYTLLGIQTACYGFGHFWFGCYGQPDNKPLFKADSSFAVEGAYDTDFSVGIDALRDGKLCRGITWSVGGSRYWRGKIVRVDIGTLR